MAWTAAVVSAVLLTTPLAAYAGTGSWEDTGPGSDSGYAAISTPGPPTFDPDDYACGQAIGMVPGALYRDMGGFWMPWYDASYPNCDGDPGDGFHATGKAKLCPSGFEVYRFYGYKEAASPVAVTRSRLNLTDWCQREKLYSFPAQTTWDANPNKMPGLPDFKRQAENPHQVMNLLPAEVGRRETGLLTTTRPVQVKGSCTQVSRENPLIDWWETATEADKVGFKYAFGDAYWTLSSQGAYPETGMQEIGIRAIANGYRYSRRNPDETKPPTPNRNGNHYYIQRFTWEQRPCANAYNFAKVVDGNTNQVVGRTPVVGTCYIPLLRQAKEVGSGGQREWIYPALTNGAGERYSKYYAKDTGLPAKSWRTFMKNDYMKRFRNTGFNGSRLEQVLPSSQYPGEEKAYLIIEGARSSAPLAAQQLANFAKCRLGTQATYVTPQTEDEDPGPATMKLTVKDARALHVGGSRFRATFTAAAGPLTCTTSGGCPRDAWLSHLSYKLSLVGTNGYVECAPGQLTGCDFRVLSYTPGGASRDAVLVAEFYQATDPRQNIVLRLDNVRAQYTYMERSTTLTVIGTHPVTGKPYKFKPTVTERPVTVSFTPAVQGKPLPLRKSGAGWWLPYPVISAVDIPLG